jgi:hypothetical protein
MKETMMTLPIRPELQKFVDNKNDAMPVTIARILTPIELGKLWVVHPSDNDPALVSEIFGTIAIWMKL